MYRRCVAKHNYGHRFSHRTTALELALTAVFFWGLCPHFILISTYHLATQIVGSSDLGMQKSQIFPIFPSPSSPLTILGKCIPKVTGAIWSNGHLSQEAPVGRWKTQNAHFLPSDSRAALPEETEWVIVFHFHSSLHPPDSCGD